jgi:hypothetical protein
MGSHEVPITEAARRLGIDYQQCRRLVLRGELAGGRDDFGRLFVSRAALEQRARENSTAGDARDGQTDAHREASQ